MMSLEDKLITIGLTEGEAKIYLLLIKNGPSTIGELSAQSPYSRAKIYTILDKLTMQGWARVVSESPKRYIAERPDKVLTEQKDTISQICSELEAELTPLYMSEKSNLGIIESLYGKAAIDRAKKMAQGAEKEIIVVSQIFTREMVKQFHDLIDITLAKGVKVIVVANKNHVEELVNKFPDIEGHAMSKLPPAGFMLVDGREFFMSAIQDDTSIPVAEEHIEAIYTTNSNFIKMMTTLMRHAMKNMKNMESD